MKQEAYAMRRFGAQGESMKEIALGVGYSLNIANNPGNKIESTVGFQAALGVLARKSNNVALAVLCELETRDMKSYTNKELTSALLAISSAWERFQPKEKEDKTDTNKLRQVVLQNITTQNIVSQPQVEPTQPPEQTVAKEGVNTNG